MLRKYMEIDYLLYPIQEIQHSFLYTANMLQNLHLTKVHSTRPLLQDFQTTYVLIHEQQLVQLFLYLTMNWMFHQKVKLSHGM